ncbi:uncharacterized protein Dwil_GK19369 [Drosophila willistoni]|uniref:Peptidase S1 domain-containing protein n=1 Tax=Drosophila willistoni TaxID=7260 RepID=B4N034_DROWI|nr:uncharacterized protein Dwil_GK19369 [Drosophila willistoni]
MTIKGDNQGAVNFGAYPWTVAIFDTEYEYRCAGALIHFQVVLTTGFCLGPVKTKLIARAGEWDMNTIEEILPNEEISEYTKIYHSKFDKYSEEYNIGLLILNKEFTALPHIQTVCLPIEHTKVVESDCLTTGWEKYSRGRRVFLQKNLMNISNELCSSKPNSNIFCASSQEEGVEWALGSSLVCPWVNSENRYSIRGLWISEAGKVNKPTYFLNVTKFTPWIIEELKNKNINVST